MRKLLVALAMGLTMAIAGATSVAAQNINPRSIAGAHQVAPGTRCASTEVYYIAADGTCWCLPRNSAGNGRVRTTVHPEGTRLCEPTSPRYVQCLQNWGARLQEQLRRLQEERCVDGTCGEGRQPNPAIDDSLGALRRDLNLVIQLLQEWGAKPPPTPATPPPPPATPPPPPADTVRTTTPTIYRIVYSPFRFGGGVNIGAADAESGSTVTIGATLRSQYGRFGVEISYDHGLAREGVVQQVNSTSCQGSSDCQYGRPTNVDTGYRRLGALVTYTFPISQNKGIVLGGGIASARERAQVSSTGALPGLKEWEEGTGPQGMLGLTVERVLSIRALAGRTTHRGLGDPARGAPASIPGALEPIGVNFFTLSAVATFGSKRRVEVRR